MRIVEDGPTRLVLRDRTLWVTYVCGAAAVVLLLVALSHQTWKPAASGALFALFALMFLRSSDVLFDKATRICNVRHRDVLRTTQHSMRFSDISDVLIEVVPGDTSSAIVSCRLSMSTREGEVPFSAAYEPSLEKFEGMRKSIVNLVFAGRAAPPDFDPVRSLAAAGRLIDAVNMLRQRSNLSLAEARDEVMKLSEAAQKA
jgi:hypothetical protein